MMKYLYTTFSEFVAAPRRRVRGLEYDLELFLGGLALLSFTYKDEEDPVVFWPNELETLSNARTFGRDLFVPRPIFKLNSLAKNLPLQTNRVLDTLRVLWRQNPEIRQNWERFLSDSENFPYHVEARKVLIRLDGERIGRNRSTT